MTSAEIIFEVEEGAERGYDARALGHGQGRCTLPLRCQRPSEGDQASPRQGRNHRGLERLRDRRKPFAG